MISGPSRDDVLIRAYHEDDLPAVWGILEDWPNYYVDGSEKPADVMAFQGWWKSVVKSPLVGVDRKLGVVGFAYLHPLHPGVWATPHIAKRKGYGNPGLVRAVVKDGLPIWFERHNLQKLWAWTDKPAAVRLAMAIGFRMEGKARHHIGGKDHWQLSILREEAWKPSMVGNIARLLRFSFAR